MLRSLNKATEWKDAVSDETRRQKGKAVGQGWLSLWLSLSAWSSYELIKLFFDFHVTTWFNLLWSLPNFDLYNQLLWLSQTHWAPTLCGVCLSLAESLPTAPSPYSPGTVAPIWSLVRRTLLSQRNKFFLCKTLLTIFLVQRPSFSSYTIFLCCPVNRVTGQATRTESRCTPGRW